MSDGSFHSRVDVPGMLWVYASPGNPGDNLMVDGNSGEMGKGGGSPFWILILFLLLWNYLNTSWMNSSPSF